MRLLSIAKKSGEPVGCPVFGKQNNAIVANYCHRTPLTTDCSLSPTIWFTSNPDNTEATHENPGVSGPEYAACAKLRIERPDLGMQ